MLTVVDTSVLLSDPKALERLSHQDVVIPLVVLIEMEDKRSHPDLGFAARTHLRYLETLRNLGDLTRGVKTANGGSIRIELNHIEDSSLPSILRTPLNDNRILAVASNLQAKLLTKDLPLRLKASVAGVEASDVQAQGIDSDWAGWVKLDVSDEDVAEMYSQDKIHLSNDLPVNTGVVLKGYSSSALARVKGDTLHRIRDKNVFDVRGRSAEQRFALDLLTDPEVGIVSLGGPAGTGKSLLALAAALDSVIEQRQHRRILVFRPLYAVGGQDLGFLPGTAEEKMSPWAAAVFDALEVFCGPNVIEEVIEREMLEVLPLTHIRGRTLTDSYVIIDEAQNLEKMVLVTALSRIGQNSKVVLTHDVAQRDNLRVGKHDGITSVVSRLTGHDLFGHVSLVKSERSPVAELAASLLED